MKKSHIILSMVASGMLAISAAAFAMMMPKVNETKAYSPEDEYAKTDDHFVACFNRNKALRDAYNGDDNVGDSTRAENVVISGMDSTSSIAWKVSIGKYSYDSFRNLKMGNKGKTIEGSSDQEFVDIYNATGVGTGHYISALYSTSAISNFQDMFVSWDAQAGQLHESAFGDIYLLCKVSGSWQLIKSYNAGYGSDDRGTSGTWNRVVAAIRNDKIDAVGALGQDVQVAVAFDSGTDGTKNSYICLQTLMVNTVRSAKATFHHWDKEGNDLEVCNYINDPKAMNTVKIYMFSQYLKQIQIDGGVVSGVTIDGLDVATNFAYSRAKEATYYNQLAYFCEVAGTPMSLTPSSANAFSLFTNNGNSNTLIIIAVSALVTACALPIAIKIVNKKKYNH